MKFLLFGTGDYYERYKKWFRKEDTLALIDNASQKQDTYIDGIQVLPPEKGVRLSFDAVVILSFYVKAMREQLIKLGVSDKKIFHFYDLHHLLAFQRMKRKVCYYGDAEKIVSGRKENRKKILLLSQDLTLGGPSIALFHAAEALKKYEYEVVYASMIDGPLRKTLIMSGIPVVVDENLQIASMNEIEWINGFSMLVCNTINFHIFLMERNSKIPVVWWLHDAEFYYDGVRPEHLNQIGRENLTVCSVGPVPRKAIRQFIPDLTVTQLLYGVTDCHAGKIKKVHTEKLCFVSIGFLVNHKGQDILLKAVELLADDTRKNIEVILVGHDKTLYAQQMKEQYKKWNEIRFTGSVDRQKIHEILNHADALICPSRQDSMPTVAAEAMMHGVPCIVSDAIGTAEYIEDGINGLVFRSEDAVGLADKITWCRDHRTEMEEMGEKARKLYEEVFSIEIFEKNLLQITEEIIRAKRM